MSNDISSLIKQYVASNSGVTEQEVVDKLKELGGNIDYQADSVFEFDSDQDTFVNTMWEARSSSVGDGDKEDFMEAANLLFDILNADGNDVLSEDELSSFKRSGGSHAGEVTAFSFNNKLTQLSVSGTSGTAAEDETETGTETEESDGTGSGDTTSKVAKDSYDFSKKDDAKAFLDLYIGKDTPTYESVIDWLLNDEVISEEEADTLRTSISMTGYTADEQAQIDGLVALGKTEAEAIEILTKQGKLSSDSSELTESQYKEIDPEVWADQLYESMNGLGTKEQLLEDILFDENISDKDFARIVEAFNKKYGSQSSNAEGLVTWIENDTSGDFQTKLTYKLGERLANAAKEGDPVAQEQLARELYSGTADQSGTADDFLAAVFKDIDDETLYTINSKYSEIHNRDLIEDIKNDHLGVLGWRGIFGADASGEGQTYIDKINAAVRNHKA